MATHPAPPFDPWQWWQAMAQTWAAGLDPAGTGRRLQAQRLVRLIESTLHESPLYRRRSGGARVLADFAPIDKRELMLHFDDWATNRCITRAAAETFIADRSTVADAWLGRYVVWTSSGTSGEPGIFVQDAASLAAYDAIDALRLRGADPVQAQLGVWGLGQRYAYVGATGGHFAGHVSLTRLRRIVPPALAPALQVFSVLEPLDRIADALQAWQPQVLITYPSCAAALAQQELAGALHLRLAELWLGGEQYTAAQRVLVSAAFGCTVRNSYGASEFFSMAFECSQGQLHLNDDWVILETVDARGKPVAPGAIGHATLLTNLANRTQPLLRYRLGDRLRLLPARCPCGSAWPALEVQGREGDTLRLTAREGRCVTVLPLALETAIEDGAGVAQFQVLRRAGSSLELRFEAGVPDRAAAFRACKRALTAFLAQQGVVGARIKHGAASPWRQGASGKLRRVVDLADRPG